MNTVFARQPLPAGNAVTRIVPNSIFLVGPTPREAHVPSWRPEALTLLKHTGFSGHVFIPEDATWGVHGDYDHQIWWEIEALSCAAVTALWLPRQLPDMPGFTSNTEFGFLVALRPERLVCGAPLDATKVRYQRTLVEGVGRLRQAFSLPPLAESRQPRWFTSLADVMAHAVRMAAAA